MSDSDEDSPITGLEKELEREVLSPAVSQRTRGQTTDEPPVATVATDEEKEDYESENSLDNNSVSSTPSTTTTMTTPTSTKSIFDLPKERSDEEILQTQVVVTKDKRGDIGSRAYNAHYAMATEALSKTLQMPHHISPTTVGEEKNESLGTLYVNFMMVLRDLDNRAIKMDMTAATRVPAYADKNETDLEKKWDFNNTTDLTKSWHSLSIEHVMDYQKDINQRSTLDSRSSDWLRDLIYNSSDDALRSLVSDKIDLQTKEVSQRGGIVMLKVTLDQMFSMTGSVRSALQKWLEDFSTSGMAAVPGEDVIWQTKRILIVVERLAEVNELPSKTSMWILQGFCLCSTESFKDPFGLMLQRAQVTALEEEVGLRADSNKTLAEVKGYCQKANTLYTSICLEGGWYGKEGQQVLAFAIECWNCKGDHPLGKCKKPKNQAVIEKNKKAWQEKNKGSKGGYTRTPFGSKKKDTSGGSTNAAQGADSSGVKCVAGVWMTHCKKTGADGKPCGWNCHHSTKHHTKAMKNPSAYPSALPSSHPLKIRTGGGGGTSSQPSGSNDGTAAAAAAAAAASASGSDVKTLANKTKVVFEEMSKSVADADLAATFEKLSTVWGSLN